MQFAVIGLGRFGARLATRLAAMGHEVIGIDRDRDIIQELMDRVTLPIAIDASNEQALLEHGIDKVEAGIVAIGDDFQDSVMVTALLKAIGVPRVISRAVNQRTAEVLLRIGADEVVNPEDEAADAWAHKLVSPALLAQFEVDKEHRIAECEAPASWIGKTLADLSPRENNQVNIVAVKRREGQTDKGKPNHVVQLPRPNDPFVEGDRVVVFGRAEHVVALTDDES